MCSCCHCPRFLIPNPPPVSFVHGMYEPKRTSLKESLVSLRDLLMLYGWRDLAIPRIGTGGNLADTPCVFSTIRICVFAYFTKYATRKLWFTRRHTGIANCPVNYSPLLDQRSMMFSRPRQVVVAN